MCYATMTASELLNESVGFDSDSLTYAMGKMIDGNIDICIEKNKFEDELDDLEKELEVIRNNADSITDELDAILEPGEVDRFEVIYKMLERIAT